jgi:hypothetical protein
MKVFKGMGEPIFLLLDIKIFMLLYKESISICTSSNSCISSCYELSFTCICFLVRNMDFDVLTLLYQVCLFVDHLTYEFNCLLLCLFTFSTKALNIHNSRTSVILKMRMHLRVIGLYPLHSSPFVIVCFTPKYIFNLMGLLYFHI